MALPPELDPLKVVATAVSPVVMVSATAILVSGVNSRYISISDRVRNLSAEYRRAELPDQRRQTIRAQMVIFHRRLHLVSWAMRILYGAAGCFVTIALFISLSIFRDFLQIATLPMFLLGLILVLAAIVLQLIELQASNRTIDLESVDVLRDAE
jgi:hypothetical protein